MTIGTSLGNHYQDEHHYQARSFTPFPGFHQSDNIEDRRKEFFDPRTDPVVKSRDFPEGGWLQQDNETQGNESSGLSNALGGTDLLWQRQDQITRQSTQMEDELLEAEKKAGITPEDSGLPPDWGTPDLPTRKTDQQVRDEAKEMVK